MDRGWIKFWLYGVYLLVEGWPLWLVHGSDAPDHHSRRSLLAPKLGFILTFSFNSFFLWPISSFDSAGLDLEAASLRWADVSGGFSLRRAHARSAVGPTARGNR